MRKTKIICTIGPACDTEEIFEKMVLHGLDCARLNFSHGVHSEHEKRIAMIKKVRTKLNKAIPIILDTKGPEIRLRNFTDHKVSLNEGDTFTFCSDFNQEGDKTKVGLTFPNLSKFVKKGNQILADDGKAIFEVLKCENGDVVCKVMNNCTLSNHKSINIPGVIIEMPYISEVDKSDILFGIEQGIDYIAASFVRRKEDVFALQRLLHVYDKEQKIKIIAKIENTEGIEKMDEIIDAADGVMVARGDMGVEVPFKCLPAIQKSMIDKCYRLGKIVVTATQMLDSMQQNPRPTRAEVSDVANAIYDHTTAIMLSGESAAGLYPVESVSAMKEIAEAAEASIDYHNAYLKNELEFGNDFVSAISNSAVNASYQIGAKAIICATINGLTAFTISAYHPTCPIIAITVNEKAYRQLQLAWNVYPVLAVEQKNTDDLFLYSIEKAIETGIVNKGDNVIITAGSMVGEVGTDMFKLHVI